MDPLQTTSRKKMALAVFIIIFFQLCLSTYFMAFQKTGFFADDLYSYGYANSPGTINPMEKGRIIIHDEWIDSQVLHDYLEVSPDERFTFGRVAETLKRDAHPPLFYYLLHAICSLTPGMFSVWSAYIINVAGFILLQVFLYRLSLLIGRNRFVALLIMTFFGFTSASINIMVLLRMYMLATGLTVAFTFYALRYLYDSNGKALKNADLLLSFIFLYLSAMTVYLSVLFAFLLTFYICTLLLIKLKIRKMLCFGTSMLLSVGAMYLSFPAVYDQLVSDKTAIEGANLYPFMLQFRTCIYVISNGVFGINTPIFPSMLPFYCICVLAGLCIIYALVHFIFRKDQWFVDFMARVKTSLKSLLKRSVPLLLRLLPFILITLIFMVLFSRNLKIFYYKAFGMRYFYILTPFVAMTILTVILKLFRPAFIRIPIIIILTATSLIFGSRCYLERELQHSLISSHTAGADVMVIENESDLFMYHVMDLMDSNSFLFATPKEVFEGCLDDPLSEKAKESSNIILIVDHTAASEGSMTSKSFYADGTEAVTSEAENDVIHYFRSLPAFEKAEHIDTYYGSYLYRLK
ncbi:MAG: hypothetical protein J5829_06060 [Lachnospiraceae bacterium]|nr:hypothetical protein [Lachnospiraceae bacterium]